MQIGSKGIALIKEFEGLKLKPYRDAVGIATVGYGNTYYEDGSAVKLSDASITEARAEALLRNVLARYESAVSRYAQVPLKQHQFDALVSLAYNIGNENLRKSTLMRELNAGRYGAAANQFARWNRAGGKVLPGLTRRRNRERELFLS